jgi:hypothetical protein
VRLGTFRGAGTTKRRLEAGFEDVKGEDVHASYDAHQALALDDG